MTREKRHPTGAKESEGSGISSRRGAKAYQTAAEAVFAIPIGAGLGYWADSGLGTGPWGLLVGIVLGFAAFVLRLVKMRSLVEEAAAEAPETPPEALADWDDEKREDDDW